MLQIVMRLIYVWFTGLSGKGKSTTAEVLPVLFLKAGFQYCVAICWFGLWGGTELAFPISPVDENS